MTAFFNKIDFVDCSIVAMAERLNITRIMTVDQCDFGLFRPSIALPLKLSHNILAKTYLPACHFGAKKFM